jgi:hypothetical protein
MEDCPVPLCYHRRSLLATQIVSKVEDVVG